MALSWMFQIQAKCYLNSKMIDFGTKCSQSIKDEVYLKNTANELNNGPKPKV